MNVARSSFSLLQKGYGARAGSVVSTSDFLGGFHFAATKTEEKSPPTVTNISCRSLSTRAKQWRGGRTTRRTGGRRTVRTPTMQMAKLMPLAASELEDCVLIPLAVNGQVHALEEVLKRNIMAVDSVSYEVACEKFQEIAKKNREGMWLLTIPYKLGIGIAITFAVGSFPMVFELSTVQWFNEFYVTTDIPEPRDLETPLEVGSWAWNWMEPPLGTLSFVLLCMQYIRAQIANMGVRPYTQKIMSMRADKLTEAYPQYDPQVIKAFSEAVTFYDEKHGI